MAKNFLTIQNELAELWQGTAFSALSSNLQTSLKLRVNMAKDKIVAYPLQFGRRWDFLKTTGYISTTAKHTIGNIDVTQYSANIAGGSVSPVFTSSMVGRLLIVSGGSHAYRIKTFTDATHIVLETPYLGSTATNQSYSIVQDLYPLASDFNGIVRGTVKPDDDLPLEFMSDSRFEDEFPNSVKIGTPLYYGLPGMVGSDTYIGRHQIRFMEGFPETAFGVSYKYSRTVADLSADGDISLLGYAQGGDNALMQGSILFLRKAERDGNWSTSDFVEFENDFNKTCQEMWMLNENLTEDREDKMFGGIDEYLG